LDPSLEAMYPEKDYHRLFLGEVKTIFASERFIVPGA
jgi:hypothetical protein